MPSASLQVGPNVNITQASGNQAESTISINPTNPNNLFESDTVSTVGHYSTDGGATWQTSNMSALPSSLGDVQTTWDPFGNLLLTEFGPGGDIIFAYSSDGGATFKGVQTITSDTNSDQPSIAFGPSGVAGIPEAVWIDFTEVDTNAVVVSAAPITGLDNVGTFSTPQALPGSNYGANAPGDFGSIAVGPNGQVLVNYQNITTTNGPDTIRGNLDPDGLGPSSFGSSFAITSTNVGGHAPIPAQPNRTIDAEGNLAWDRSGGAHNGRVYLVYADRPSTASDNTNIYVRYSDDNGTTWSSPVAVDPIGNGKSQFNPAIAVDQTTGNVAVTWYDTRNSGATNDTTQVFGTVSLDGGSTWMPSVQISKGTSNASSVDSPFDYGDYDQMSFSNNVFYRTWADNSNSTGNNPDGTGALDIYTARVTLQPNLAVLATGTEGVALNNVPLGGFVDNSGVPVSSYTVTVNWGDGTTSSGTVQANNGSTNTFTVFGSHTYTEEGNYTVSVSVNNGTNTFGPFSGLITIADAPLTGSAQVINAQVGSFVNNALVGIFSDTDTTNTPSDPQGNPADYTATVYWPDGSSSVGHIVPLFGNTFAVYANSPFSISVGGLSTVQVVVRDVGGASVTINSTLSVPHNPAIPPLIPEYQADTGPVSPPYANMQDALTNLIKAEQLFVLAVYFGNQTEQLNGYANLLNAFSIYYKTVYNFDLQLPGSQPNSTMMVMG